MVRAFKGAVVAAGRGERLRQSGVALPKPLVELGGEPLLLRQARMLREAGADDVIAVVNSEVAELIAHRGTVLPYGLRIVVRDTPNSMETLLVLGEHLGQDHFLMATVDTVIAPSEYRRFIQRAIEFATHDGLGRYDGALGVVRWRAERRPLFIRAAADGTITELGEQKAELITAGIYFLPTRIFSFAQKAREAHLDAMRQFFALLVSAGLKLAAIELAHAIDIDEAADLEAARAIIRDPEVKH